MVNTSSVVRDLRALGASAPLRAAYEASKRSGFHSVLFRAPARTKRYRSEPLVFGSALPTGDTARARCLEDASLILKSGVRVFGTRVSTGVHAPWNIDPLTGEAWPQLEKWWEIDIRSDNRLADVKFVWEAARHRDLVILARAAALEPDGPWFATLETMLTAWVEQCPPERGVNWYSSLELALRAIAWGQVLALVGGRFGDRLRGELDSQLTTSARHIMLELLYTVSSMKNNHLLADGLGLVVLGRMFPSHPAAKRWQGIGDSLFHKQLARHMRPDGSMIEDSLSYHRFVLEMLIVRCLLGDASAACQAAMRGASLHLQNLGVLDGPVPQYGDWDEGRVLTSSGTGTDTAGSALLGLALSGHEVPPDLWDAHDELAWYGRHVGVAATLTVLDGAVVPHSVSTGGFIRAKRGGWSVWFKTGGGPSHQHADLSSVWIMRDGRWLVADPGTGSYNGPIEVRNGFRTSEAHPVWHPADVDQLDPHRAFRWLNPATGYAATSTLNLDGRVVMFGWHDAFERLENPMKVARVVVLTEEYVAVIDGVSRELRAGEDWQMTLPLGQSLGAELFGLETAGQVLGQQKPFRGWHSDTYGEWHPSNWLQVNAGGGALPLWGAGARPEMVNGQIPVVDGLAFEFNWEADAVGVRVTDMVCDESHELSAERD